MQNEMNKSHRCGGSSASITVMLMLLLLSVHAAVGRPDVRPSPFALELQPPLAQTAEAFNGAEVGGQRSVDSYGNPIAGLRPIDTPDGRKVVSAQGLQFEIPTYASGITEIRQPADDLLPPHIDLLDGASTPTAATAAAEENPFDSSTVPAWLRDFDYPDVGPGVPYNPDNFKEPASTQPAGGSKPNDFRPQGFEAASAATPRSPSAPLPTRAAPAAASVSSAFPSKVTLPLPGTVQGTESSSNESPEPPLVLVPPADKPSDESATSTSFAYSSTSSSVPPNPTTNSVTNFAARFDPQGIQSSAPAPTQAPKVASEDQFPPFSGGSSTDGVTKKVEYKKSDEGKVISTPISGQRKDTSTPPSNTGKYTGGFGAPAGLLRPQAAGTSGSGANTNPAANSQDSNGGIYVAGSQHEFSNTLKANRARPTVNPGRYTGGFGAPVGVLSAQAEPRPFQQAQQTQQQHSQVASPGQSPGSHSSRFGGPPGVLVPFDNVQRAGGQ
ncbi:nascent polypeptide-associated complex subunit alpha, muscle-specific form isoform X5 [Drosophila subobscura]|uniref:nascent polypeptide-associated complex subunit alpha, muscle-specific form isoform X5 n=1 Tax=Drosophila subobscura TaxID=7241 RepID=UPI00155AC636|nr:nascent polypeptide-associated complex subunit alpha, muscle-specific form isoform X5 [Drosophila subobscura]